MCSTLVNDEFNRAMLKNVDRVYYGPLTEYEFELLRHIGTTSTKFYCVPYVDLSVPHKLV
jgi:hypothetical protein